MAKPSEVLRLAAELIETGSQRYACCAIDKAIRQLEGTITWLKDSDDADHDAFRFFASLFKPEIVRGTSVWFGTSYEDEHRNHRITALLLTADMAESVNL